MTPFKIGLLLFPDLTQLDLTAPYEVFARLPQSQLYLAAPTLDPVQTQFGLTMLPDTTFAAAPQFDVVFVGGGLGVNAMLQDQPFLEFLRQQGAGAKYVTSVCTGSLLLAAAGLLTGYKATTHWLSLDLLGMFPQVEVVRERVVIDRNRITGGGVTSGIDFGLVLAAHIFGEEVAKNIQLNIEYDPQPPFSAGSPRTAEADLVERVIEKTRANQEQRRAIITELMAQGKR